MKMPLLLFSLWMIKQYNLPELAINGWVHIKMRRKPAFLPTNAYTENLLRLDM
jgi:hypothetical protein